MKFKSISIKNFRNFENVEITLDNKNVFFGMNDVGKTNFLYALRFVFDREQRKNGFIESDYFRKDTSKPIEIILKLDISDVSNSDSQKIRAKIKGNIISGVNSVIIKLKGEFNNTDLIGNPILFWGYDDNHLKEINNHGTYSEIDEVFKVIYIDAYVDVYSLFKKNAKKLIKNENNSKDDEILAKIDKDMIKLNNHISSLSGIKKFEGEITPDFKTLHNKDISIEVKSEIAIKGLYSNIIPYIKNDNDGMLYPTSGEGRRKMLVYSIYNILSKEYSEKYINLYLIEEPENHLHASLQKALSNILFINEKYSYLFLTTHSSDILLDMDNINLVRIYNENKIDTKSVFFTVPDEFKESRKTFNKGLSEALFADKVLLVEGPSELILFEKVLSNNNNYYEADGTYILAVGGIRFQPYYKILKSLGIFCCIKTDNDLRKSKEKYYPLGFSRINELIEKKSLPITRISGNSDASKRELYMKNIVKLNMIRKKYHIFLSKCSLEEDLDEVLHDKLVTYLPDAKGDVISYLQASKQFNMAELVKKLDSDDCDKILNSYNFECLKEVI